MGVAKEHRVHGVVGDEVDVILGTFSLQLDCG